VRLRIYRTYTCACIFEAEAPILSTSSKNISKLRRSNGRRRDRTGRSGDGRAGPVRSNV
jgi:hypothetical protein